MSVGGTGSAPKVGGVDAPKVDAPKADAPAKATPAVEEGGYGERMDPTLPRNEAGGLPSAHASQLEAKLQCRDLGDVEPSGGFMPPPGSVDRAIDSWVKGRDQIPGTPAGAASVAHAIEEDVRAYGKSPEQFACERGDELKAKLSPAQLKALIKHLPPDLSRALRKHYDPSDYDMRTLGSVDSETADGKVDFEKVMNGYFPPNGTVEVVKSSDQPPGYTTERVSSEVARRQVEEGGHMVLRKPDGGFALLDNQGSGNWRTEDFHLDPENEAQWREQYPTKDPDKTLIDINKRWNAAMMRRAIVSGESPSRVSNEMGAEARMRLIEALSMKTREQLRALQGAQ